MIKTAFHKTDFQLAYLAAFAALGITPGDRMAQELAELTHSAEDCIMAVRAMKGAAELARVFSALEYLRPLHAAHIRSKQQKAAV